MSQRTGKMRTDDGRAIVKVAARSELAEAPRARRVSTARGGLLAFDVGVRKTYTALAILARVRQEGFVRRRVIVGPRSMVEGSPESEVVDEQALRSYPLTERDEED